MLRAYRIADGGLHDVEGDLDAATLRKAQWIELCDATDREKKLVTETLDIALSPLEDYEPFQVSSHFSATDEQLTLTGLLLVMRDDDDPHLLATTFIRAKKHLITISPGGGGDISALVKKFEKEFPHKSKHDDIFATLLDMIVDHLDSLLDDVGHDLDRINTGVFQHHVTAKQRRLLQDSPRRRNRQLEHVLTAIGPAREVLVKLRRSVLSFRRMVAFLREQDAAKSLTGRLEIFERDLKSIAEAETDLSAAAGFLLDAIVGYIALLQNKVMNVLTLVATVLTPPMVIGAIYGMNFKVMPELQWAYGYPFALGLMVVSTVAVYLWLRVRGM